MRPIRRLVAVWLVVFGTCAAATAAQVPGCRPARPANAGWAQILRLAGPEAAWTVDLELGPRLLRAELLAEATFTRDAAGRPVPTPDSLLIAATYDRDGRGGVRAYVRDDNNGTWARSDIISGDTGRRGEDNSVRAARVHRDRVTGEEFLFLSVGTIGLFRASYDPTRPGRLAWAATPEYAPTSTRILGMAEANGSLFVSEGNRILRRIDGATPHYEVVLDLSGEVEAGTNPRTFSTIGGIRGLTALPAGSNGQQSLIFLWHAGRISRGCVIRLDPGANGRYTRHEEGCMDRLISQHIGVSVRFVLGAYNLFMPVTDPTTGETLHVIGLETLIPPAAGSDLAARNQRRADGGFYAGAMYALRDAKGVWRIGEVNGKFRPGMPELVSIYTYALSPFGGRDAGRVYFGGYDCNYFPSTNTAWVYRADLGTVLAR